MLQSRDRILRAAATLAAVLLGAGALTSCAGDEPEPTPTPPAPSPTVSETPDEPITAPLTGLELDAEATKPALTAKIDNHPQARPQIGLQRADVVVEELVEGGTTRYAVIWHSDVPDQIGPVRSVRPMDPAIAAPYGGILAYSGGQQRFVAAAQATGLLNVVHDSGAYNDVFTRAGDRIAPHNLMLAASEIVERNAELDPPRQLWSFATDGGPTAAAEGADAALIEMAYSAGERRTWECEADIWQRSQNGTADLDAEGDRLQATNVIALTVETRPVGGDVFETLLAGYSGGGYVASGCSSIPVTWSQSDIDEPIVLETADGAEVELAPGNTWLHLVPTSGSIAVS